MNINDIEKKWLAGLLSDTEALDAIGVTCKKNINLDSKALDLISKILDLPEELPYSGEE